MKKTLVLLIMTVLFISVSAQDKTLYDFEAKTIDGKDFDFSTLKGKKVLVVNTASKCGLTPQYEGLQKLFDEYGGESFTIIGFPANNFLKQEPGSNEDIQNFCSLNYGVSFQMMEKIDVKGKKMHPIYQWLTSKENNGVVDAPVKWNFQKFMINEQGKLDGYVSPKTKPDNERILNWITEGL
ncbi:MAG: glutathione peroxidase [Bacteroidetes bacterium]|jgi:glutathione peroxidase|nr:glutathione peroxidase [Bacteroidota bacterium]MBT3748976.1 glutathione peroxidase [Bacteroidota bacterium]MBT4401826.1 glutathione peroxidase [Bacteroidota bacterium]MBT4411114.1 glutathione peroxidase [Bacteroidota bacterium]MBT5426042.1 glutathione peroxidase [Bacteroidota bacterium]